MSAQFTTQMLDDIEKIRKWDEKIIQEDLECYWLTIELVTIQKNLRLLTRIVQKEILRREAIEISNTIKSP